MKNKKIAILGATSHIAKGLILNFCKMSKYELNLFSRSTKKASDFLLSVNLNKGSTVNDLNEFGKEKHDVIINCIGIGDPSFVEGQGLSIFELTEKFDNMILSYLRKNKNTVYINFSSGAVYGIDFNSSVGKNSVNTIRVNKIDPAHYYSIAKINSEVKHRSYPDLRIMDIRVFSYFSQFIDPKAKYLMAEIINSIQKKKIFLTGKDDIVRDYIGSEDLFLLVCCCIKKKTNGVYDVYSRKPVRKFQILKQFQERFHLDYKILKADRYSNGTGTKQVYCSKNKKGDELGYAPKYDSLGLLIKETEIILSKGGN